MFKPATRKAARLRMAIDGPAGSGKTFTGLRFAHALGKRVAVIDTEHGSASKYLGEAPDGTPFAFDVVELASFSPTEYTQLIEVAGKSGYDVLLIDSLSHAWEGKDGALELVDRKGGNSFTAWKDITPMHRRMVEAILASPCHVIATMRSKVEYVLEEDSRGKKIPRRVGMAPVQRAGMEYEFDLYCSMDHSHTLTVSKSRCRAVTDAVVVNPSVSFIQPVLTWLSEGTQPEVSQPEPSFAPAGKPAGMDDSQREELDRLTAALNIAPSAFAKRIREKYGVTDWHDLTHKQASEIISSLEDRLAKQSEKQPA